MEDNILKGLPCCRMRDLITNSFVISKDYEFVYVPVECGDGWSTLIRNTMTKVQDILDKNNSMDKFELLQIKEKFGTLVIYYNLSDEKLDKEVYEVVHQAEIESQHICELCGEHGHRYENHGLLQTLCNNCLNNNKGGV